MYLFVVLFTFAKISEFEVEPKFWNFPVKATSSSLPAKSYTFFGSVCICPVLCFTAFNCHCIAEKPRLSCEWCTTSM